ncbi:serine hydrolase [Calothrix rhizosoleniae]|uniref:serine hydrolase n=1 Tax=Calothrix rhizosoleniae TaxID=888997 RepID=UPI001F48AB90|nr:serine hydrolase [Calothrix rhizosoleniae]
MFYQRLSIIILAIAFFSGSLIFLEMALASVNWQPYNIAQVTTPTPSITPKAAIERLFTSKEVASSWFAPNFLKQVPITQIRSIISSIKGQLGNYQEVKRDGNDYVVIFDQGSLPTNIVVNSRQQISGLRFKSPILKVSSLEKVVKDFQALPGKVSFLVLENSSVKAGLNTKEPLAVGSAFKLAVLKALKSQIAAGKHSWKEVVTLREDKKSLPSGILQTWPDNSPLTVQTLASLMISVSDNTATDILIDLVGREAIESITPRNRPFFTTRELFVLKATGNDKLLQRYRQGKEKQRRQILGEIEKLPLPDVNQFIGTNPKALDMEWFFTAEELCGLMKEVGDLPLMSINPGVADAKDWQRVAFKGGSEPGVLNLTTWLQGKNGKQYCVVGTWNNSNAPVDEVGFSTLYGGAISLLAEGK